MRLTTPLTPAPSAIGSTPERCINCQRNSSESGGTGGPMLKPLAPLPIARAEHLKGFFVDVFV